MVRPTRAEEQETEPPLALLRGAAFRRTPPIAADRRHKLRAFPPSLTQVLPERKQSRAQPQPNQVSGRGLHGRDNCVVEGGASPNGSGTRPLGVGRERASSVTQARSPGVGGARGCGGL